MSTNEGECVICFTGFDHSVHYPIASPCGHKACEACIRLLAADAAPKVHIICPLCRKECPADHMRWDLSSEILENAISENEETTNGKSPQMFLDCTICREEKPFDDFICCLQCNPQLVDFLEINDLVMFSKKSMCADCNQKHHNVHITRDRQEPLEVSMFTLTQSSPRFMELTIISLMTKTSQLKNFREVAKSLLLQFLRRRANLAKGDDDFKLLQKYPDLYKISEL